MSSIESIFESIPVEEAPSSAPTEKVKNMGDRVAKGSMEDRIEAFGEMLEDDDYTPQKTKPHEPVKVEKEKVASVDNDKSKVAQAKDKEDKIEKEEGVDEEVQDGDEKPDPVEEKEVEIPKDRKFKVPVDGAQKEVTLQELMNDYSGRQAIGKRFNELDLERRGFQKEKEQILSDQKYIQKEVNELRDSFKVYVDEFKKQGFNTKNPSAALDTLLDKIGVDSYSFNRAMFEHNLPEYAKFFEMDEAGQEAYFVKKENEFFRKKEQTFAERTEQAQALQARQRQEFDLIKQSGLSTDSYNLHFDELEALGAEDLSVENVLEFAKVKPIFDRAGSIVAKTSKANDIALIQDVSRLLMEFPNTTEQEIIEHIDGTAEERRAAKILKDKENFTVKKNVKKSSNGDKYFTDEEMAEFRDIRR